MRFVRVFALAGAVLTAATVSGQVRPVAAPAPPCERTCLEGLVDRYLDALVAHDAFSLPLTPGVVFSENSQRLPMGDGLWNTASGLGEYRLYVSDPEGGQVGFFGTVLENGGLVALALRLKLEGQRISEVETLVVRDAAAAKAVDAMEPQPAFLEAVPAVGRPTRQEMIAVADRYFNAIDGGKAPFGQDCNRVQNGTQTTNNPSFTIPGMTWNPFSLGCQAQIDTTFFSFVDNVKPRRFAVVDRERGLVFGLFMFHVSGTVTSYAPPGRETMPALPQNLSPYTIAVAELYKIKSAQIGRIEALQVNVPYGTPSPFGPTEWRSPRRPVPVLTPSPATPGPCNRACLEGFVTRYLDAMVAHDPARLPLTAGVVFTENDVPLRLGEALWRTASGIGTYRLILADPATGQVGFMGTIRENGKAAALVLRLKIDAGRIAEAETLVLRNENTAASLEKAGAPDPLLLETVPAAARLPRGTLVGLANTYFEAIEQGNGGVAPFDAECNRFENGIRTSGQGCSAQLDTHIFDYIQSIRPRRFTVVDEERQVVFGNFMFNHPGDITWINMPGQGRREMIGAAKRPFAVDVAEAFRIKDRKIRKVEALMVSLPYGTLSPYVPKEVR
ncbi:MAG TPA: hypothetical protein VGQ37_03430 [Vicinamibacterales bacterium]|jgi:hypothetical protein|nr:hypothetical protein [Vicinamibacterales bacterium]